MSSKTNLSAIPQTNKLVTAIPILVWTPDLMIRYQIGYYLRNRLIVGLDDLETLGDSVQNNTPTSSISIQQQPPPQTNTGGPGAATTTPTNNNNPLLHRPLSFSTNYLLTTFEPMFHPNSTLDPAQYDTSCYGISSSSLLASSPTYSQLIEHLDNVAQTISPLQEAYHPATLSLGVVKPHHTLLQHQYTAFHQRSFPLRVDYDHPSINKKKFKKHYQKDGFFDFGNDVLAKATYNDELLLSDGINMSTITTIRSKLQRQELSVSHIQSSNTIHPQIGELSSNIQPGTTHNTKNTPNDNTTPTPEDVTKNTKLLNLFQRPLSSGGGGLDDSNSDNGNLPAVQITMLPVSAERHQLQRCNSAHSTNRINTLTSPQQHTSHDIVDQDDDNDDSDGDNDGYDDDDDGIATPPELEMGNNNNQNTNINQTSVNNNNSKTASPIDNTIDMNTRNVNKINTTSNTTPSAITNHKQTTTTTTATQPTNKNNNIINQHHSRLGGHHHLPPSSFNNNNNISINNNHHNIYYHHQQGIKNDKRYLYKTTLSPDSYHILTPLGSSRSITSSLFTQSRFQRGLQVNFRSFIVGMGANQLSLFTQSHIHCLLFDITNIRHCELSLELLNNIYPHLLGGLITTKRWSLLQQLKNKDFNNMLSNGICLPTTNTNNDNSNINGNNINNNTTNPTNTNTTTKNNINQHHTSSSKASSFPSPFSNSNNTNPGSSCDFLSMGGRIVIFIYNMHQLDSQVSYNQNNQNENNNQNNNQNNQNENDDQNTNNNNNDNGNDNESISSSTSSYTNTYNTDNTDITTTATWNTNDIMNNNTDITNNNNNINVLRTNKITFLDILNKTLKKLLEIYNINVNIYYLPPNTSPDSQMLFFEHTIQKHIIDIALYYWYLKSYYPIGHNISSIDKVYLNGGININNNPNNTSHNHNNTNHNNNGPSSSTLNISNENNNNATKNDSCNVM